MRPRVRKALRVAGIAMLALLGALIAGLLLALLWLHTTSGSETVGRFVASEARNSIQGDLKVRAIEVHGLRVCVDGVELRDPDGHKAASAERACVSVSPLALRSRHVLLREVELTRPWVEIAKVPGTGETTLARAIAAKKKSAPGGPMEWIIDVQRLDLHGGMVTVRPTLGEPATFALEELTIANAHARYAAGGAAAEVQLSAQLIAPGKLRLQISLDATVDGPAASGNVTLRELRVEAGESGVTASGSWDLARQAGAIALRGLTVTPQDVAELAKGRKLVTSTVRGEADLKSDGKTAQLDLRLDAAGGRLQAKATSTLAKPPVWDLQLSIAHLDPGAITPAAPRGELNARVSLHGKGVPEFDEHGVRGELSGAIHVGPARLDRLGAILADLDAKLLGRYAIVKAFSATALGLTVKAHGAAAYDEISLDLDLSAPDLRAVGRAVGALTRKPALPISGSAHLTARVTGSPSVPDAQVHLRAPRLRWGPNVVADGLAVDGVLHGLEKPDGSLQLFAQHLAAGNIDLGSPRIAIDLQFPVAHLGIDAGVKGGALQLQGDATIDDDEDGLVLSNFVVSWPGNQLNLMAPANLHLRDQLILEPLNLIGDHGSLRFEAQVHPPPGRIEAALVVTRFELDRLPEFALPKDLGLHGVLDANAVLQGPRAAPDLDLQADLHGAGAKAAGDLHLDAHTHAHLHAGRLKTEGWAGEQGLLRFEWDAELPVEKLATQPASAPLQLDARLTQVDLAKLADRAKISQLQKQRVRGLVDARIVASGTLGAPRGTVSIEAKGFGTDRIKAVDARLGFLLEKGKGALDGTVALQGKPALGFTAQLPFELQRGLRDSGYLKATLQRPLKAELAVDKLDLRRLTESGLLPEESAGILTLSARLGGTPEKPTLQLTSSGENVTIGRLHGVGFQTELSVADKVKLTLGAQSADAVVAHLDAAAALSGAELLELAQRRDDPDAIAPLLDRAVSVTLEIPGLPVARASQLAGKQAVAEGRVEGRASLIGTPARPHLTGQLTIKDIAARKKHLGSADLYLEADSNGALLHLGIDPPGGGSFLAHATLEADFGARSLLRSGVASILDGKVGGEVQAKHLDLAFLSGLFPRLRKTGGTLDGDVKLSGDINKPVAEGEAHLRSGLFDVVGQGVYEDVGLDASFSPKEVVIDRLTGSTGTGTFAAILVASRKPAPEAENGERIEFTGEVHLGDDESVRDRKLKNGQPMRAGPLPVRQAGEQRADLSGELDIFGDYTDSVLTMNAKIPDARVVINALPDKKLPKLKENPDVLLVHPGEKPHPPGREPEEVEAEQKAITEATFRLHAHLDLVHLYVKASDFEFPVESNLDFDYDARHPDAPTADGTVHVPEGSFTALQRRFTIQDARIIETGGEIDDPELEIKAQFENPQATVTIIVSGTAQDPQLDMTSTPAMDQDAIAFFLATGRVQGRATQTGGGVDLSGAASSVLGSLLFGEVRKELADVLPVDVLTIDTSSQGVSEASVGKYIGDRIFIGYRQRLVPAQTENTEEGRIEYEISKSVSAEATVGDRNSDLTILYTKDF